MSYLTFTTTSYIQGGIISDKRHRSVSPDASIARKRSNVLPVPELSLTTAGVWVGILKQPLPGTIRCTRERKLLILIVSEMKAGPLEGSILPPDPCFPHHILCTPHLPPPPKCSESLLGLDHIAGGKNIKG